jgi:hypothetical protein
MGMFDSFLIDCDQRKVELQTKRFECVLGCYRLGDVVGGAPAGVLVVFDVVRLGASGRRLYGDEPAAGVYTAFLVLVHTVFTDYDVVTGELQAAAIAARVRELKAGWSDTARVLSRWTEFLSQRQQENARLKKRVRTALAAIEYARRPRPAEGEPASHRWLLRPEEKRIDQGEDPFVVLCSILEEEPDGTPAQGAPQPDPLDEFRL